MEKIKRMIEELTELVTAKKGAIICFVNPGDCSKVVLHSVGYQRDRAIMVGTAVVSDDDAKEYILKGVEAAQSMIEERRKEAENDKTNC